jgi:GT2 family glycosyltransferase
MSARLFRSLDGFDEALVQDQDADLTIRAQQAGHTLVWVRDAVVFNVFRPSLKEAARQFYWYGVYDAAVYRKLRGQGLNPRPWGVMFRPYLVLALTVYRLLTPRRRSWVMNAAQRAGRVVGSVRFRVICP